MIKDYIWWLSFLFFRILRKIILNVVLAEKNGKISIVVSSTIHIRWQWHFQYSSPSKC